jgi:hypothetical protein
MESTLTKTMKSAIAFFCMLTVTFFATTDGVLGQSMTMSPYKICLNSVGNSDNFQAVVPMHLEPGYRFSDCEATLYIGDYAIADAYGAKYCYVDDNLLIYFDRDEVLSNEALPDLAGGVNTATVEGNLIMVNTDGEYLSRTFTVYDEVLVFDPDKK